MTCGCNARGERIYENTIKRENTKKHNKMKNKKNKYKEKDAEKRRKEWDKTRREVNNKKWMLGV